MIYEHVLPVYAAVRPYLGQNWPKSPSEFNFEKHAPLVSNYQVVFATLGAYLVLVFLHFQLRGLFVAISKAIPSLLQGLFIVHNVALSFVSFVLLALMVENLGPRIFKHGLMWGICHEAAYEEDHRIEFFYYVNYLLKYYELLDTVLLILKGKKLDFLHYFHHAMTLFLCFVQLQGRTSIAWVPIGLNLSVHVIMYYYYARTAISSRPVWWKKYLTTLQITQFVLDLIFINFAMFTCMVSDYKLDVLFKQYTGLTLPRPTWGVFGRGDGTDKSLNYGELAHCYGSYEAAWLGWAVLSSYLLLFVRFFIATYSKKKSVGAAGTPKSKRAKRE